MVLIKACPYLEFSFEILARKWNGVIIHYLYFCDNRLAHFSDMLENISNITPKALSLKLNELIAYGLVEKKVVGVSTITITYELTKIGCSLAAALEPIQKWAIANKDIILQKSQTKGDKNE